MLGKLQILGNQRSRGVVHFELVLQEIIYGLLSGRLPLVQVSERNGMFSFNDTLKTFLINGYVMDIGLDHTGNEKNVYIQIKNGWNEGFFVGFFFFLGGVGGWGGLTTYLGCPHI